MPRIHPATRDDIETIVAFQVAMALETEALALDPETVLKGVTAVFDDPRKGHYWIAEKAGQPVGSLLTIPEWSDWRNGTVLWIHSLYVTPAARAQGIFKAMYAHLKKMVRTDPGLRGLRLYVDRTNAAAQQAYLKMGMNPDHYTMFEWLQ